MDQNEEWFLSSLKSFGSLDFSYQDISFFVEGILKRVSQNPYLMGFIKKPI